VSAALDVMAALVLEDGRRWGDAAERFQWEDARAVLDQDGPPHRAITRPRGGAKTSDLGGLGVAVMLTQAPAGARLYACAAARDQARLLVDSVAGYMSRTPELAGALEVGAYRVSVPSTDVVLEILSADAPSAWGLRPYMLIADEIAQWPSTPGARLLWEALSTAMPKVTGSRCVVLTSAGDPGHWSRRVFDHALESPLWTVHEVPGPVPWVPADRLAEERRRLPESSFRRLHLNQWVASEDALVDADDLAAAVVLDGPLAPVAGRRYVMGLDVGIRRDATVATVCHLEDDRVVLDRFEAWKPSHGETVELQVVEEWLEVTSRAYGKAPVIYDPYQAVQLSQRLRARGLEAREFVFSAQSVGRLAVTLHTLLRERRLALPDDETLLEELSNVRLRETSPGVLRLDHDPDKHDDHAIALALAAHHLLEGRQGSGATVFCYRCDPPHDVTGPNATPCVPWDRPEQHMTKAGLWVSGPPDLPSVDIESYFTRSQESNGGRADWDE
jgi:phage terminase large subunit-like protein